MSANKPGHPSLLIALQKLETLKPDQFELYFEKKRSLAIDVKDQKVDTLKHSEDVGLSVRLIKNKRLGFSYTTSLEPKAIEKAMETAFAIAENMPEDEFVDLPLFGKYQYPEMNLLDPKGLETSAEEKVKLALEVEKACLKADPRVKGVRSAGLKEIYQELQLVDREGTTLSFERSLFTSSISCRAEEGGDNQMGSDFDFKTKLSDLKIAEVGQRAAKEAVRLLGAGQAPTMQCPAVLENQVVTELIEFLSGSFSSEQIFKGRSLLAGKEGQKVFGEKIDLIHDGLLPEGMGTEPFDGEGIPAQTLALVEKGVFKNALYDTYYAKRFGKKPSGCAGRGVKASPRISLANFYLPAGKSSQDDLIQKAGKGILITDLMGLHTANPVTGDFSLGASGILIENGKLTKPVKGFAVAGNILELFRRMTDIGSNLRFYGSTGAPSALVSEISVGGK